MSSHKNTSETNAPGKRYYNLETLLIPVISGAAVGVLGWLLYLAVANYFIEPVFCQQAQTYSVCRNGGTMAWVTAHVILIAAAVAVMAKYAVYRPLLVALGVLAALWGAHSWLGSMNWYMGALWQGLIFAVAFAVFAWYARARNFLIALILTLVTVVAARVVLLYA